jgi:hypothetical protein
MEKNDKEEEENTGEEEHLDILYEFLCALSLALYAKKLTQRKGQKDF